MTDAQYRDWLARDNAERCVLVEQDYQYESAGAPATGTLYLADREFFDTVGSVNYIDCVNSVPEFTRSLSGERLGGYTSSIGTLEIDNANGEQDFILDLALDGSESRYYLGDVTWPVSDFRLIFSALAMLASATSFDRISVQLKDTGLLLNKSIGGDSLVGGTGANANRPRPINFGYVHNVEALVLDSAMLIYVHSDTGTSTAAVAVRDRGVSVAFTDNADGTFTLSSAPAGIVTCDVVAFDADRKVSDAMEQLVGVRSGLTALSKFAGAGPTFTIDDDDDYLVGIEIPQARNVQDLLGDVTDSGNCFWAILRTGEFTYGRLRPNDIAGLGLTATNIVEDDIDEGSFRLDHLAPLYYRFQAFMSRNWIQQTDLASSLTPDEQAVYRRNGIYLLQDPAVGTTYNDAPELYNKSLAVSPVLDTLLSGAFDELDLPFLATWMETRRAMFLPWIEIASLTTGIDFYERELGDPINLINPRFEEDSGTLFQMMSITLKLSKAKIDFRMVRRRLLAPPPVGWTRVTENITDTLPQTATLIGRPPIVIDPPWPSGPNPPIVIGGGLNGGPGLGLKFGPSSGLAPSPPPAFGSPDGYLVIQPTAAYNGFNDARYNGTGPASFSATLSFSTVIPGSIFDTTSGTTLTPVAVVIDTDDKYEYAGTSGPTGTFLGPAIYLPTYSWEWSGFDGLIYVDLEGAHVPENSGGIYQPQNSGGFAIASSPAVPAFRSWVFTANRQEYVLYLLTPASSSAPFTVGLTTRSDVRSPIAGFTVPPIVLLTTGMALPWNPGDWPLPYYREPPFRLPRNDLSLVASFAVASAIGTPTVVIGANLVPVFTSANNTSGSHVSGSFQLAATNTPTSWGSSGVVPPPIFAISGTGLMTWGPNFIGTYNFTVSATNASGTGTQAFTLTLT